MFKSAPSEKELAEMAAAGMSEEDFGAGAVEVWPENWPAYQLFAFLGTQWRAGGMGIIGLDYSTMWQKMDRMNLEPSEYEELEADMQVMEYAAIAAMSVKPD